jgi:hypothetical protein
MKIFLKCPACHKETIVSVEKQLSGKKLMEHLKDFQVCVDCEKNGLGKIYLNVIKFDWENILETSQPT